MQIDNILRNHRKLEKNRSISHTLWPIKYRIGFFFKKKNKEILLKMINNIFR